MAAPRHLARRLALQALYEMDVGGHDPTATLERSLKEMRIGEDLGEFARTLLQGVLNAKAEIDGIIERTAPAWPTEQLAPIDRNILRIAIRECIVDNLTPVGAAINEAVELAKDFGSESSSRFINGVLGSLSAAKTAPQEGQ